MRLNDRLRKHGVEVVHRGYIPRKGERIVAVVRWVQWGWKSDDEIEKELEKLRQRYEFDRIVYKTATVEGHSRVYLIKQGRSKEMRANEVIKLLKEKAEELNAIVSIHYTLDCCKGGCMGYHTTEGVGYDPTSKTWLFFPSPYGFHSLIDPPPKPIPLDGEEEAVRELKRIFKKHRCNVDPFAAYIEDPTYGFDVTCPRCGHTRMLGEWIGQGGCVYCNEEVGE